MASNVFNGRLGQLTVAGTSTGTGVRFGGVRDWNFSADSQPVDVVHQDTSGWTERIDSNSKSWSLTCGAVFLSTSASVNEQDTLRAAMKAGTRKYWTLKNSTASGSQTFAGYGYVTGWTWAGDIPGNTPQLHGFTIAGDGAYAES